MFLHAHFTECYEHCKFEEHFALGRKPGFDFDWVIHSCAFILCGPVDVESLALRRESERARAFLNPLTECYAILLSLGLLLCVFRPRNEVVMGAIHERATTGESSSQEVKFDVGLHCLWGHAAKKRDIRSDTKVLAFVLGVDIPDRLGPEVCEAG